MEERVYQGSVYRRAGPGQPWKRVGASQGPVIQTQAADPTLPDKGRQAAADATSAQAGAAVDSATIRPQIEKITADAARSRLAGKTEGLPPGYMWDDAGNSAVPIPGYVAESSATEADVAAKKDAQERKAAVIRSIMGELLDLYKSDLRGQPARRGFGAAEYIDALPKNERFTTTAEGMLGLIRPIVAQSAREGDSDREMAAFLAYIPKADDADITIESKLRNLERLLSGVVDGNLPSQVIQSGALNSDTASPFVDAVLSNQTPGGPPRNAMQQDTTGVAPITGLAGGSDATKSIPIPPAMQQEYEDYVTANRGRLDPVEYARFRTQLQQKHGFGPGDPQQYMDEAQRFNSIVEQGGRLNMRLPAPEVSATGLDRLNASVFNNPVGAAVMGAGSMGGYADEVFGAAKGLATGTDIDTQIANMNAMRQASANQYPGSTIGGQIASSLLAGGALARFAPGAASALAGTGGRVAATGTGIGAMQGFGEDNDDRFRGAAYAGVAGAGGGLFGRYALAPAVESLMRSRPGQAISGAVRSGVNAVRPGAVSPSANIATFAPGERAIPSIDAMPNVEQNLRDAQRLGLPYALADADPKLRMLAGSVSRKSPDARDLAETTFDPRARGQADRARDLIDGRLAPITDIEARRGDLFKAGSTASSPYYEMAGAQQMPFDDEIAAILKTPAGKDALKRAYTIAQNEGRNPTEMGFVIDEMGEVGLAPQAGRFERVTMGNPNDELTRQTVRGWNGAEVPKAGPIDLVGWLRLNGGLRNQGGELKHMGVNNSARSGMDFVGQEQKFGPLVNDVDGMNLDDAAERAWEAGYFPELRERPSINQFLEAMRDTQEGRNRRFLPADLDEIDRFENARGIKDSLQQQRFETGQDAVRDSSVPAGQFDYEQPPMAAYGEREAPLPTFETLDLIKKGLDARINQSKDAFGNIDFRGDPELQAVEGLRQRFVGRLDQLNQNYPKARAEYQKYAKRADALQTGMTLQGNKTLPRTFDSELGKIRAYDDNFRQDADMLLPEAQRGFATGMADVVDTRRFSGDPYEAIYGTPAQQGKVAAMFPEGSRDFDRVYNLERDMSKTRHETLGGSPTQARISADSMFESPAGMAVDAATQIATGGGFSPASAVRIGAQMLGDNWKLGLGRKRADQMAPVLFNTNPQLTLDYLDDLAIRQATQRSRKDTFKRRGGIFGSLALPSVFASE